MWCIKRSLQNTNVWTQFKPQLSNILFLPIMNSTLVIHTPEFLLLMNRGQSLAWIFSGYLTFFVLVGGFVLQQNRGGHPYRQTLTKKAQTEDRCNKNMTKSAQRLSNQKPQERTECTGIWGWSHNIKNK